ncbi:MAG TPA: PaaI family thioesterase [Candidatus Binatia bacterium]|nr:PaaI family thioesterase [Candidatus Binatia bacterium]
MADPAEPVPVEPFRAILERIPYCRFLGITVVADDGNGLLSKLCFSERIVGNAALPAVHGGVIGAFLETAAIIEVMHRVPGAVLPKPIDITIAYLRSAGPLDTFARAIVTKHGRRVTNFRVEAWQESPERPVATAQGHFLVLPDERDGG